jgi:hypothetical protein
LESISKEDEVILALTDPLFSRYDGYVKNLGNLSCCATDARAIQKIFSSPINGYVSSLYTDEVEGSNDQIAIRIPTVAVIRKALKSIEDMSSPELGISGDRLELRTCVIYFGGHGVSLCFYLFVYVSSSLLSLILKV